MRIARFSVVSIIAIFGIVLAASLSQPQNGAAPESGSAERTSTPARPATPVIVELFTSEGCSDCPPADQLLYKLEQAQPVAGAQIIPLEQHVDYWDTQGWHDPFSSEQFTQRQKEYVFTFKLETVYTPEMVVDGTTEFVGSDGNRALAAIAKAALVPKANLHIENLSDAKTPARSLPLRVTLAPLGDANPKHGADVLLAITEDHLASNVTRGENAGAHMNHLAVVRELRVLGHADSAGAFSASPNVNLGSNWKRENLHAVAFVQDHSKKYILAASTLSLSQATN